MPEQAQPLSRPARRLLHVLQTCCPECFAYSGITRLCTTTHGTSTVLCLLNDCMMSAAQMLQGGASAETAGWPLPSSVLQARCRANLHTTLQGSWVMAAPSTLGMLRHLAGNSWRCSSKELGEPPTHAWRMAGQCCGHPCGSLLPARPCTIWVSKSCCC